MPDISFYVLATESLNERYQFACKLIEKAYRNGVFAYVLTDSVEQSQVIDDLLWTFRPGSFIPHEVYQAEAPDAHKQILIGHNNPPVNWQKTLVNVSTQIPQDFQQVERILEILDNSEATKAWGRQRYKQYQQAGFEITTHKM